MHESTGLLQEDHVFRLLVEAVRDYAIFMLDPEGTIATWNAGAERLKGYSAEEAIGASFMMFYPDEDRQRDLPRELLRIARETGHYDGEGWRVRKDGSRFWAHVTITAVHDEDGELMGFGKVTRDLTEQRQQDIALRETAERFHQLADNMQEVFWITTPDMQQTLYVSPGYENVWGRSVAEAQRGSYVWLEAVHPEDRQRVEAALPQWRAAQYEIEYRIVRPDGTVRWIHARGVPVRNGDGDVERVVGIAEDVTTRRMRDEEQRYLAEAGRVLASSLDYEETLRRVARLTVPEVADWCAIYIAEGDELRLVDVAHRDPAKVALATEFRRRYPPDPAARSGAYKVFMTGEPDVVPEISAEMLRQMAPDEEFVRILTQLGLRSAMTVPMIARDRTLGVISLIAAESARRYGPHDLAFAESLAARAAMAVDNARLHRAADNARQRVTNIFESITDAFVALDREWRLTYLNPRAREMILGDPAAHNRAVIGSVVWELIPGLQHTRIADEYRAAMSDQRERHFEEYFAPWQIWFDVHVYPSADGLSIFFRDVTPRKRAEQEREQLLVRERSLSQASTILASSLDYEVTLERVAQLLVPQHADYCVVDVLEEDGRLQRVAAAHVDRALEELILSQSQPPAPESGSPALQVLQTCKPLFVPEVTMEWTLAIAQSPQHAELIQALRPRSAILVPLSVREQVLGILWLVRSESDGQYTEQDLALAEELARRAATALENARLYRAMEAARGEAERRATEETAVREELERVTESRARLMRGFSHDLKNPLGAADGFLQLIEDGILDEIGPRAKHGVGRARRAIHSALRLIEDLLELARAEAGHVDIKLGITDVRAAAREIAEEFRAQAEAEGLQLNIDMPADLPLITSDTTRVRQILGNLLSNAVKYTPSGGCITVRADVRSDGRTPDSCVTVSVVDNGPGIPEEQQRFLFKEFTRLETVGEIAGAGIGLAISQRIAHALRGQLTVDSEVGKGSTFTLWLPRDHGGGTPPE